VESTVGSCVRHLQRAKSNNNKVCDGLKSGTKILKIVPVVETSALYVASLHACSLAATRIPTHTHRRKKTTYHTHESERMARPSTRAHLWFHAPESDSIESGPQLLKFPKFISKVRGLDREKRLKDQTIALCVFIWPGLSKLIHCYHVLATSHDTLTETSSIPMIMCFAAYTHLIARQQRLHARKSLRTHTEQCQALPTTLRESVSSLLTDSDVNLA